MKKMITMLAGTAIALVSASSAFAQSSDETGAAEDSGEIIVTAAKRAENLQDVPISVSAITGDHRRCSGRKPRHAGRRYRHQGGEPAAELHRG